MQFSDPLAETTLKLIEEAPKHIREMASDGYPEDALQVLDSVIRQSRLLAQCMRNALELEKAKRP